MNKTKTLWSFVEHYGCDKQRMVAIEEMAELTKALCKLDRAQTAQELCEAMKHAQEELADVEIMAAQLKLMLGEQEVNKIVLEKIQRQKERMEHEQLCADR